MVYLKKDKIDAVIKKRHPWIFSGAIERVSLENSALTPVMDNKGNVLGWGLYSEKSDIAVRMISFAKEEPAAGWLENRIKGCYALRKNMNIPSNAYRLVNSEGDYIPGLVIDVFNRITVLRPMVKYFEKEIPLLTKILTKLMPGNRIYVKRDEYSNRKEDLDIETGFVDIENKAENQDPAEPCIIEENGINFKVDYKDGQKTGFYLDQRDSRLLLKDLSADRCVANLFSYTGAFSLYAVKGKALSVVSVDSSKAAIKTAQENQALNQFAAGASMEWICDDVIEYLKSPFKNDIIILDPPPYARKKRDLENGLKTYKYINQKAIEKINSGGIIFTFSCSGAVDKITFLKMLYLSSLKAGREIRVLKELHAPIDHPFSLYHPEGEYLKGWMIYVE